MNKIFRIVWSQATQSWVVVSELTKAHKKQSASNAQKSAVKFSGNFLKSSAIALTLLSGHSAYAALNQAGTGSDNNVAVGQESKATQNNAVAVGKKAQATGDSAIALGFDSESSGNWSVAIGLQTNASNKQAVAVGSKSQATGENSIAIGNAVNASKEFSVALGSSAQSTNKYTTAVGGTAFATQEGATALGYGARATATNTIAIGNLAKAEQEGVLALGSASVARGKDTIAIGNSADAKKEGDIIIGKDAKSRNESGGRSVAIGYDSTAGSTQAKAATDITSIGKNDASGSVAIGVSSYTGVNKNNAAINSSVAIGAGAGAGFRAINAEGLPTGNGTDPDDNATVLVKAFGGTTSKLDYFKKTGDASKDGFFSFQGVDINEGTALGRNTRAIGDQSVAIGAQSIAGMGSIVIGGNDIQAYDRKKYFKAADPNSADARGVNDFNAAVTPGTGKKKPTDKEVSELTITEKYNELVGSELDRSYRASYGQDGSTVIGMQAHSTTPLGVAIGTNSIVRKGAFGSTAIGSGASIVANAEAAVAIGMGAEAQGNYAVAAGTAARAKESAVAAGYQANADKSAVAVGDSSKATTSSVAVGRLAQATKEADIAVGQGAVASGEQGAIAMGLGTQAQGDSSIMIGGSEITKVANQRVSYQKEKIGADGKAVIKTEKKTEMIGGVPTDRTVRSVTMENTSGTIQQAYGELTNGGSLNIATLDYSLVANRNGHGSISMGIHSLSTGDLGTAIGTGARVTKLGGVALGTGAISELQNGVAIGTGSRADSRSIGTRQTDISYDENGKIVPFDSKAVAYTFYWAGGTNTSEGDVVSFGSPGAERQLKNVAAGRIADDSTDAINGSQLNSVTKRMSSGWAVEAEKDHNSSGVLKLKGNEATGQSVNYATDGKSSTKGEIGTATGHVDKVRLNDEVKIRVGDNLVLNQENATRDAYEDPDNPNRKTGTHVTSKFTYSLNPVLKKLKSAEFKNDAGDTTVIDGNSVTVTPVGPNKQSVALTTTGLNNGGNAISNVAGNLPSTKNNDAATGPSNATTSQDAPTLGNTANQVNPTNAATVSDVLNAGWNIQGDGKAVDFVKPYDTVNFAKGDGTSVSVESKDGKTSTVKYSVNLGNGLEKDANNNITVKAADKSLTVDTNGVKVNPADKSLEVTDAGLKVKAGDKTLTTDEKGLKVNTGDIESVTTGANPGTVKVKDGDAGKIATVDSVVSAVNSAAFTLKASANGGTRNTGSSVTETGESIKAGSTVEMIAGKNLDVKHDTSGKITFATVDNPSFSTVQVGGDQGPKLNKSDAGDLKVSGSNGTDPVKITNVKAGDVSATSTDAINGSQFHGLAKNKIKLAGKNGDAAATETTDQTLDQKDGIKFTIKSSDGTLLDVTASGDTITLTPKTGTITTGTNGIPTANTANGKLVTADQLVTALTQMGWKATAGKDGTGTVEGNAKELIKAGETVTFKAGNNLAVKQAGKDFIYSLNPVLTGLTSATFINAAGDTTVINSDGMKITPKDALANPVSLTKDGLDNGGKTIKNVTSGLTNYPVGTPKAGLVDLSKPTSGNPTVPDNTAATVGDLRNMGWVVSSDKTTGADGAATATEYSDKVKNANEVKFVGKNAAKVSGKTENGVRTITVDVEVPETKTAELVSSKDGSVIAPSTDPALQKALKDAKDALATLPKEATPEQKEAAENKVKAAETALNNALDDKGVATAKNVADMINASGFTLKTSATADGKKESGDDEVINPGKAVEMVAGKNLTVKQEANGKVTYATKDDVSFNTVQVGGSDGPKLTKTKSGDLKLSDKDDTKPVAITNVKSNLPETKNGIPEEVTKAQPAPILGTEANQVNASNAATVGDVLNAGWNLQNNGEARDFVKPYDTVNFVDGINTKAVVTTDAEGKVSNVQIDVKDLPIAYTNEAGDKVVKAADGKYYKESDLAGKVYDPKTKKFKNADGTVLDKQPTEVAGDTVKTNLVNPNAEANKAGDATQLGNVASGANTFAPVEDKKLGNDGKWYNAADVLPNGQPKENVQPVAKPDNVGKAGLIDFSKSNPNNAATVGDLQNLGWVVSAKGNDYSDQVRNANEVKFVGEGTASVTGKTDENGVRTITVKVDDQVSTNNAQMPVNYTTADGTKVYPVKDEKGNVTYHTTPDGKGQGDKEIPKGDVITSINGPEGTKEPTTLSNVAGNLDGAKKDTTAPTTAHGPVNTTDKNADNYVNPNNAATVGDVLNAGWNLQNNGEARDFVKPYDTVNFVDGINTKAVVTTDAEGKVSNVQIDVKDLPIAYTNEAGDKVVKAADGKYYKESDLAGKVYDPKTKKFKNADGTVLDEDKQPREVAGNTVKTNLVNPNAEANKAGNATQLGNVANGANTFDPVDGKKMANDGKWYPADQVEPNGQPKKDAPPVEVPNNIGKAGLIDFSKSNPNNVATVGDLQNLGWVVSAEGNDYSDQVRNANEVKFVGEGTATVTGETDKNGVRTITVSVDDQVSTNNAQTPVNYTTADGTKVYPLKDEEGNVTYHTTPDGMGEGDKEIAPENVITSLNGPKGTKAPTTLSNVAGNLDGAKKDTKAPTTEHSPVNTTDKNAVNYVNPNNAATVGDVLNAGWNLQNNGEARDFVKPYDTVNFVDGINTKAVVTTDAEGKVSNVQIDVKDLPIAYTNEAGDKVVKAADGKYYKESDLAGKVYDPKTKKFKNADGTVLDEDKQPREVAGNTVKTNLVNPNAEANKAGNATQLGNVANGANTFDPVDGKKMANDGKWYPADQVEPNGQPKKDAPPVEVPNNIGKAGLIDFSKSNPNNVATVGDLQNLGWVVSAEGNDYSDQVRNANEVKFVGEGTATVTGETDKNGVRTITVSVDDQVSTNNAQTPVNYTTADGTKVYPLKDEEGNVTYHTTPDGMGEGDKEIAPENVITSLNGPKGTKAPTTLSNVAGNLDGAKKDTKAPTTEHSPVNTTDKNAVNYVNPNNAATVGDVLNAGWNLQNNGEARDFVKPYDTVNFINGKGTVAVVETADDATRSTVKFDVDAGEITADTTKPGAVKGPVTADEAKKLADDLEKAEQAVKDLPADAPKDKKAEAQKALKDAQVAAAPLNKVATAQNVADMINASGFTLKTSATADGKKESGDDEVINPGKAVEMIAGKNLTVKQEANGKVTYATKDDVSFNTVNVGEPETYKNAAGETVVKGNDGKFYKPNEINADGKPNEGATGLERDKVTVENPQVTLKREAAKEATNNDNANKPSSALNVSSSDGKPTQLKGVGSVLNTTAVPTTPEGTLNGKAPTEAAKQPKLVNLTNADGSPLDDAILNSAATVRDIANMGWVVSTKDSNGYKDVVKNANQVDFVGKNGITVTGETKDGIRTITVETAQSPVVYTDKAGNKLVKAGDNFYPADSVVFGDKAYPAGSVVIGGKVYPKGTTPEQVTAGTATPATALANGKKPADVIASMNNGDDKSANAPMQLGNVAQGAETIAPVDADGNKLVKANDGKYYPEGKVKADGSLEDGTTDADVKQPLKLANDGKWYPADQISAKGVPTDTAKAVTPPAKMDPAAGLVDFANSNPNNAATVGDLQNMGWIVGAPTNGYTDQVRNTNKVNFVGTGIATVTGETDAKGVRTITVNVANGLVDIAKNEADTATGAVTGPKKAAEDALTAAKAKLNELNNKPTATEEEKKAAQDAVNKAQSAVNNAPNLVATAQNVADMINKSGFNLKTSAAEGQKVKGTKDEGELINPGATVEMVAGKNMSVKQDENGKVTYATKDDVEFNTVKIANPNGATYTDKNNNPLVKADDGKFYPADQVENGKVKDPAKATPVDADKVTTKAAPSVEFKAEKATPATNNTGKDKDGKTVEPTTALNISSDDGKPTQLKGVGSVLNTADVKTSTGDQRDTDGNITPAQAGTDKLVDLGTNPKKGDKPLSEETLNSAATVRDLANMGWVVSAKDNNYTNTVKNANKVEFKGGAGISVEGKTTTDGVREITISVKDGEVIKPNQFTAKVNGTDTPVTKVGDQYYNTADIDPKTGKPNTKANPVTPDAGTTPTNAGDGYVTGNKVATAIQKSGFVVGKQTEKLSAADFNDKDEKVNPDDELRFADGNNTKVKLATKESVDKDGNKVTTTTVKVDVTGLPVQYTDKNGTPVTKVGDKYFTVDDKGNPTATEVKPSDLTTNMVNPAAAPNVIGAPTALGNVKSNLPSVNDADKNAKDVAGNPIAGKDNKSAPITATEAADLLNPKTADGKANPKFAGNNAATVSDVLNAGWNLQNNGEAKDFVKPYDTVNFVDGKGTKAVVETTPNGTTSSVKFDIDTGKITNNDDGSVQGPVVTQEMTKALENATNALNSLPANAPASVRKAAEQAVADAANNIANVANKVATAQDVANAINKSGFALTTSANGGEKISGTPEMINPGKKVEMVAGKNMTVKQESNGKVTYATASNVTFDSVQFGDKGPKITNKAGNINVSGPDGKTPTKITGVAPGEISATSKDAINGSQLHAVASNLNNKINKVGKHADAGTASALAAANIPQAYTPGKSLVGIAAGNYQGQNGLAVGMSRISDNGKIIIRLSGTANSQGKTGVAAGVGYQW